jgi:hypothetical protein
MAGRKPGLFFCVAGDSVSGLSRGCDSVVLTPDGTTRPGSVFSRTQAVTLGQDVRREAIPRLASNVLTAGRRGAATAIGARQSLIKVSEEQN